jgi:hypothetical protein
MIERCSDCGAQFVAGRARGPSPYGGPLSNDLAAMGQAVVIGSNFYAASPRQRPHAFHYGRRLSSSSDCVALVTRVFSSRFRDRRFDRAPPTRTTQQTQLRP